MGGAAADAAAEHAVLTALAEAAEGVGVGYSTVRSEFWGEGDLTAVADGAGARPPGQLVPPGEEEEAAKEEPEAEHHRGRSR